MPLKDILLSQIIVGRNDNYLGNFKHRLEMGINYNATSVAKGGFLDRYEMLVVDWNSDAPLREALRLNEYALQCVKFLEVTPQILAIHGGNGPVVDISRGFNVGIRRAKGAMVMLGPADILIPASAIKALFSLLQEGTYAGVDITACYLGLERFLVPWQAAERLTLDNLDRYLLLHTPGMRLETRVPGVSAGEGGHIVSREKLLSMYGFNEQIGGWGAQDIEISLRVMQRGPLLKLTHAGIFCYDLQQPPVARAAIQPEQRPLTLPERANDENWGLGNVEIHKVPAVACPHVDNSPEVKSAPYDRSMAIENNAGDRKMRYAVMLMNYFCSNFPEQKMMVDYAYNYMARANCLDGYLSAKLYSVATRFIFQNMIHQWCKSDKNNAGYQLTEWFGEKRELQEYLFFAMKQGLQHNRKPWDAGTAQSLLAIVATLGKQRPHRFLYAPSRELYIARAATFTDPTLEITSYDHCSNLSEAVGPAAGEIVPSSLSGHINASVGEAQRVYERFKWLHCSGFQGHYHSQTGEMETAFERIKDGAFIGEPYQAVYLDLDFLSAILGSLCGKLRPLIGVECAIICKGTLERIEVMIHALQIEGFTLVGKLPSVAILHRSRLA